VAVVGLILAGRMSVAQVSFRAMRAAPGGIVRLHAGPYPVAIAAVGTVAMSDTRWMGCTSSSTQRSSGLSVYDSAGVAGEQGLVVVLFIVPTIAAAASRG